MQYQDGCCIREQLQFFGFCCSRSTSNPSHFSQRYHRHDNPSCSIPSDGTWGNNYLSLFQPVAVPVAVSIPRTLLRTVSVIIARPAIHRHQPPCKAFYYSVLSIPCRTHLAIPSQSAHLTFLTSCMTYSVSVATYDEVYLLSIEVAFLGSKFVVCPSFLYVAYNIVIYSPMPSPLDELLDACASAMNLAN